MSDNRPTTESRLNPDRWIDQLLPAEALAVMLDNQAEAIPALYAALPAIDGAVAALHQRRLVRRGVRAQQPVRRRRHLLAPGPRDVVRVRWQPACDEGPVV